jgi:hypothetical protein
MSKTPRLVILSVLSMLIAVLYRHGQNIAGATTMMVTTIATSTRSTSFVNLHDKHDDGG